VESLKGAVLGLADGSDRDGGLAGAPLGLGGLCYILFYVIFFYIILFSAFLLSASVDSVDNVGPGGRCRYM
jgi:hypothetical protein